MTTNAPAIGLVTCPCFAFGSPPLAVASLQAVLREAGQRTVPFDLDFLFMREDPAGFAALYKVYSIGHPEGADQVQFVVRPMLSLMALIPEPFSDAEKAPYAEDLAVVARAEEFLIECADRIRGRNVRVVMSSVYVSTLLASLLLAKALKTLDPTIPIVFGGPGVGVPEIQELVLRLGWVDVCATGEGERIAPMLADRLLKGRPLCDVPGVSFLEGETFVANPVAPLIPMTELRTPDFEGLPIPGFDVRSYRSNPNANTRWFGTALPIATTRGCVMRCTFCSETNYWQKFRKRAPETVVAEIAELRDRWGVTQFLFCDSLLNGNLPWLEEFCERCVAAELGVEFVFAYFRPTRLSRELLERMAQAGFRLLSFGLETASQELLDSLKKGTKVAEAEQIVADALDVGIHINISILCGFPRETAEHVLESIRFVQRLQDRVLTRSGPQKEQGLTVHAGSTLRVEPYSRMYQQPERSGLELHPVTPQLPAELEALAPALAPLLLRWSCSVDLDEMRSRSRLLLESLNRDPTTLFLNERLEDWIEEETVFSPVRSARVLTGEEGERYLATDAQVLAQVDDLTSTVWEHVLRSDSVADIRQALGAEPDGELDLRLRTALVQLLTLRFVYVEDFRSQSMDAVSSPM